MQFLQLFSACSRTSIAWVVSTALLYVVWNDKRSTLNIKFGLTFCTMSSILLIKGLPWSAVILAEHQQQHTLQHCILFNICHGTVMNICLAKRFLGLVGSWLLKKYRSTRRHKDGQVHRICTAPVPLHNDFTFRNTIYSYALGDRGIAKWSGTYLKLNTGFVLLIQC